MVGVLWWVSVVYEWVAGFNTVFVWWVCGQIGVFVVVARVGFVVVGVGVGLVDFFFLCCGGGGGGVVVAAAVVVCVVVMVFYCRRYIILL